MALEDGHTPGTLNKWLTSHGGYVSSDVFVWGSVAPLGLSFVRFERSFSSMKDAFNSGHVVILNVHGGRHWVLATAVSGSTFSVHDPGFNTASYSSSDIVDSGIMSKSFMAEEEDTKESNIKDLLKNLNENQELI